MSQKLNSATDALSGLMSALAGYGHWLPVNWSRRRAVSPTFACVSGHAYAYAVGGASAERDAGRSQ